MRMLDMDFFVAIKVLLAFVIFALIFLLLLLLLLPITAVFFYIAEIKLSATGFDVF